MNLRNNDFKTGLITGLLVPMLTYGILTLIFTSMTNWQIMEPLSANWRARTVALLAICGNLIPFNLHKKWNHEASMRGMILPTLLFVAAWVYYFRADFFGS